MKFELDRKSEPVELIQGGETKNYTMVEIDGTARSIYVQSVNDRVKYGPDGKVIGMKSLKGLEAALLVHCLQDEDGKAVTEKEIESWPARVVQALFKAAKEMNGLDEKAEENAKND